MPFPGQKQGCRIPTERLDKIEALLLKGEAPADFVVPLAKEWNRSRRRVWDYVARVRRRLAERAQKVSTPEADAEIIRSLLLRAYRKAEEGGDMGPDARGMVAAVKLLAEITGVAGPKRLELSGPGGAPIQTQAVIRVVDLPPLDPDPLPADRPPDGGALGAEPGTPDPVPGLEGA